jgi:ADP-ribose pyrophosphatase
VTIRSRQDIHESAVGRFGVETVELPNGHTSELVVLRHPGAAAVVPFLDNERILLLRQWRHAAGGWLWEIPAGKLDPGEAAVVCARRELEEETGYHAGVLEHLGAIFTAPGFTDERIELFRADSLKPGTRALEPGEIVEIHEFELPRVLEMIRTGEITDAKTIAGVHLVSR